MTVTFTTLKAEDNYRNSFLADEDKLGNQVIITLSVDGEKFNGMGDTKEFALEDLKDRINRHFNAKKHIAKVEIDKATGLYFFD